MRKSVLGMRIHSLRKEKGITQEELGRAVGVTAQAVSNWECGGTPDAEILPQIAEYFEVSIDNLYGRTDEVKKDPGLEIMWDLYNTKKEKRFEKAYQYCRSIQQGLFDMDPDFITGTLKDEITIQGNVKAASMLYFDEGISVLQLNEGKQNFFMMPTPQEGMGSFLLAPEVYEHLFSILGKPNRMKILLFLYKRKALALTATRLAKYLDMGKEEVVEIMQDLLELELIQTFETDTEEGEETFYRVQEYFGKSLPLLPFLIMTTDLIDKPVAFFANAYVTRESLL